MVRLPLDCPDADILAAAEEWTNRLAARDYEGAFAMLRPDARRPHFSAEWLRERVVGCGCETRDGREPRVTPPATATGERWRWLPSLTRTFLPPERRGPRGRLDWQLPLNGEWSDLVASFDLDECDGELVFVLAALRVP